MSKEEPPAQNQLVASIESPPDGVSGTIDVSSVVELQPCQQAKKIIGLVARRQRSLSAGVELEGIYRARLRCSTHTVSAEANSTVKSLVRVRIVTVTGCAMATVEADTDY